MNIAQIVPVWGKYNPETSTGINLVAREVTRGLIKRGHNVTVIAPKGSILEDGMNLIETIEPLTKRKLSPFDEESTAYSLIHASLAAAQASSFDIIHNHMEHLFLPFVSLIKTPVVTTIHGVDFPASAKGLFTNYHDYPYISISRKSREVLPYINFFETVYNGIQVNNYPLSEVRGKNLVFLGRLVPEKGAHIAIEAAKLTGLPLVIAGQKEVGAEDYYEDLQKKAVGIKSTFLNWVDFDIKIKLLQEALAVLFPISWEEPFGLVMIEAMACGTPVVAYARGSVPEVVADGMTGFIVNSSEEDKRGDWIIKKTGIEGLVEAVNKINNASEIENKQMRINCRKHVEEKFTVERMVEGYEKVYEKILRLSSLRKQGSNLS